MSELLYENGYLTKRRASPASIAASVAINGGIFALLLSMASTVVEQRKDPGTKIFTPITIPPAMPIDPVEHQKPVDPIKDQPVDQVQVFHPINRPPLGTNEITRVASDPGEIVIPSAGDGGGEILTPVLPIDPPPPIHVIKKEGASVLSRYRDQLQPAYPPGSLRAGLEGSATVRVLIGTDGRVKAVEAVRTDQEDFLKVTREQALRKWRFAPATEDGTPVESWKELTVRFQIPR